MPQRPTARGRHGPRPAPGRKAAATPQPMAPVRTLVEAGIVTAAALEASDDLATAADSLHRLGQLTSGMWRSLARELATATERLDRQVQEHLDDLQRRARVLQVDPQAALSAGMAAGHLEEHRATLEDLLPSLPADVRRLAATDLLLGFVVEGPLMPDDEDAADGTDTMPGRAAAVADEASATASEPAVQLWLFFWPAPLSPAGVTLTPQVGDPSTAALDQASVTVEVGLVPPLDDALAQAAGVPAERLPSGLSELALVCWTAHQLDDQGADEDDDDDLAPDDGEG